MAVRQIAEDEAADRTHQKGDGKQRGGGELLHNGVALRKEGACEVERERRQGWERHGRERYRPDLRGIELGGNPFAPDPEDARDDEAGHRDTPSRHERPAEEIEGAGDVRLPHSPE